MTDMTPNLIAHVDETKAPAVCLPSPADRLWFEVRNDEHQQGVVVYGAGAPVTIARGDAATFHVERYWGDDGEKLLWRVGTRKQ